MNPFAMGLLGDLFSASSDANGPRTKNATASVKVPAAGKAGTDVILVKVVVNVNWR